VDAHLDFVDSDNASDKSNNNWLTNLDHSQLVISTTNGAVSDEVWLAFLYKVLQENDPEELAKIQQAFEGDSDTAVDGKVLSKKLLAERELSIVIAMREHYQRLLETDFEPIMVSEKDLLEHPNLDMIVKYNLFMRETFIGVLKHLNDFLNLAIGGQETMNNPKYDFDKNESSPNKNLATNQYLQTLQQQQQQQPEQQPEEEQQQSWQVDNGTNYDNSVIQVESFSELENASLSSFQQEENFSFATAQDSISYSESLASEQRMHQNESLEEPSGYPAWSTGPQYSIQYDANQMDKSSSFSSQEEKGPSSSSSGMDNAGGFPPSMSPATPMYSTPSKDDKDTAMSSYEQALKSMNEMKANANMTPPLSTQTYLGESLGGGIPQNSGYPSSDNHPSDSSNLQPSTSDHDTSMDAYIQAINRSNGY